MVQSIIRYGRVVWPWLGVAVDDISAGKALEMEMTGRRGILVQRVWPDGPAGEAGIRPGDVITAIDGLPITSVRELRKLMRGDLAVGQRVSVEVLRDGERLEVEAELTEMAR